MAKGPEAFRTISEAADELNVPQHVLRFWETKFTFIRPMKRAGGRRFYRPADIAVLKGVRRLLHDEGYTIKGVQRLHREEGLRRLVAAGEGQSLAAPVAGPEPQPGGLGLGSSPLTDGARDRLAEILAELEATKARLDGILKQ
ncbi:MerR family transcriptional regulator [Phenylobacterium soli]|uniref:MerR family transcriptional regulator n=1 Tax=Phenylobacterium soli TaxID=2170551 RepID=A0A328ALK4_9CAUL|nr:MerR family transcriptional regulator [Phenylobacterium soli]RAK55255.1 MerR family transcriptional regulator [Phenylobacterium soli]